MCNLCAIELRITKSWADILLNSPDIKKGGKYPIGISLALPILSVVETERLTEYPKRRKK